MLRTEKIFIFSCVRRRVAYHLPPQRDLMFMFDCNGGTKQWTDTEQKLERAVETGTIQPPETAVESLTIQRFRFNTRKRKYSWIEHHSVCNKDRGRCNHYFCNYFSTTITITISRNYEITSVLYVFYYHCRCLLLSSSLHFFVFFSCVFVRV